MVRHRGRRQVEFPACLGDPDGVVRAVRRLLLRRLGATALLVLMLVGMMLVVWCRQWEAAWGSELVSSWVSSTEAVCTGGDAFQVGFVGVSETNYFIGPYDRFAAPYFLIWRDARGIERTYPLCVGGYTLHEAGWGVELRAWWSPEGRVKRVWLVARPAMPEREPFVLGALDTASGEYWSAYGWPNYEGVSWPDRNLRLLCSANPLPNRALSTDHPTWATIDGGQVLARVAAPARWDESIAADEGVERGQAASIPGNNWNQRMAGTWSWN